MTVIGPIPPSLGPRPHAYVLLFSFVLARSCCSLPFLSSLFLPPHGLGSAADMKRTRLCFFLALLPAAGLKLNQNATVWKTVTVWIATGASSLTEKYLAMVLPVSAFVAFGAEHSVSISVSNKKRRQR